MLSVTLNYDLILCFQWHSGRAASEWSSVRFTSSLFNLNRFSGLNVTKERAFVADFFVQPELLLSLRPGRVVQNHGGHASHVKQGRELLRIFEQDLIQP